MLRYDYPNVINVTWHPTDNMASFTTSDGELYIYTDFVPAEFASLLDKSLQAAPFIHDPLAETSGNARQPLENGSKTNGQTRGRRRGTLDSLDEILGSDGIGEDEDDFVSDDDGAGYADALNRFGKRGNGHLDEIDVLTAKRRYPHDAWEPEIHHSFQSGSTPWRGNRKYLCKEVYNLGLGCD